MEFGIEAELGKYEKVVRELEELEQTLREQEARETQEKEEKARLEIKKKFEAKKLELSSMGCPSTVRDTHERRTFS